MNARRISPLAIILAIALTLRIAAAVGLQAYLDRQPDRQFLIAGDADGYWKLAGKIAAGEEYRVYDPPRHILRMPGFPAVLALACGNLLLARLILAVIGTVAVGLVYSLGKELADERIGLMAAGLAAVSPAMTVFSVMILSETTFAATLLLSLLLMARLWSSDLESMSAPVLCLSAILIGITVSLSCYVRPSWLLFGPVFAFALAFKSRSVRIGGLCGFFLTAGMFLALLPWAVRNYRVTHGRIVFTTLWVGPSLYDGLNPNATGDSNMQFFRDDDLLGRMSEYEMDREYRRRAWTFARDNPGRVVSLGIAKMTRFWKPWPNAAGFQSWWMIAIVSVFSVILFGPAVYGSWHVRHRGGILFFALFPILYFAAIHSVFVGSIRYRIPVEYPLCIVSAIGLTALWNRTVKLRQPDSRSR